MAHPYRVLLVDLAQAFGGAEMRVLTQARAMQGLVEKCAVAALKGSTLHEHLTSEDLPVEVISSSRSDPRLLLELRRIIKQNRYQIVDAHNVQSIFWGHFAATLAGAPGRVATIHSDYGREYPGLKGSAYEGVLWLNRFVVKQYINVTEVLQEKSERRKDGHRAMLIHNAVPVPPDPYDGRLSSLRQHFGFSEGDFIVASIARLKPVKGQKYLIDGFAQLNDLPHLKLLIVGDGPLLDELTRQVRSLGLENRVHFAGFRKDIPGILQAVDCVCMPSLSEALPYTVLEAASYARPLLVTKVGGMATLLQDGKTAIIVPPQDATALAKGIRQLVQNPEQARQYGIAGYELVRTSFSVDLMMQKILEVYERALR
jgi:glycosyltransferase involved in cell wall biosynthesis